MLIRSHQRNLITSVQTEHFHSFFEKSYDEKFRFQRAIAKFKMFRVRWRGPKLDVSAEFLGVAKSFYFKGATVF